MWENARVRSTGRAGCPHLVTTLGWAVWDTGVVRGRSREEAADWEGENPAGGIARLAYLIRSFLPGGKSTLSPALSGAGTSHNLIR